MDFEIIFFIYVLITGFMESRGAPASSECVTFIKRGVCKNIGTGDPQEKIMVYLPSSNQQTDQDRTIANVLSTIKDHPYHSCKHFIKRVLCYQFFPLCMQEHGKPSYIKQTCKNECEDAKKTLCMEKVKDIPEIKKHLLNYNCSQLPETNCLPLNVPSDDEILENSCQDKFEALRDQASKAFVCLLRDSTLASQPNVQLNRYYKFLQETSDIKDGEADSTCSQTKFTLKAIKEFDVSSIEGLRNLEIQNVANRVLHKYCKSNGEELFLKASLGYVKTYSLHKVLSLNNMAVYAVQHKGSIKILGEGTYELCFIKFKYFVVQESKEIEFFHGSTQSNVRMVFFELSHPVRRWMGTTSKEMVTGPLKLLSETVWEKPKWSVLVKHENRISIFNGPATTGFYNETISIFLEWIVGVEQDFWAFRVTTHDMKFFNLLLMVIGYPIFNSTLSKQYNDVVDLQKTVLTFATDKIELWQSDYAKKLYGLYEDIIKGVVYPGVTIYGTGLIRKSKDQSNLLLSLLDNGEFSILIDIDLNGDMKLNFTMENRQSQCAEKNADAWKKFESSIRVYQIKTKNIESTNTDEKIKCRFCCKEKSPKLLSIDVSLYKDEDEYLFPAVFVDATIKVTKGEVLRTFTIKKYFLYHIENI